MGFILNPKKHNRAAIIREIDKTCVLKDKILVGDQLIGVDDDYFPTGDLVQCIKNRQSNPIRILLTFKRYTTAATFASQVDSDDTQLEPSVFEWQAHHFPAASSLPPKKKQGQLRLSTANAAATAAPPAALITVATNASAGVTAAAAPPVASIAVAPNAVVAAAALVDNDVAPVALVTVAAHQVEPSVAMPLVVEDPKTILLQDVDCYISGLLASFPRETLNKMVHEVLILYPQSKYAIEKERPILH